MDIPVPYHEKDLAKALGARWNAKRRTWYVPPGIDVTLFKRWSPEIEKWDQLADGKGKLLMPGEEDGQRKGKKPRRSASSIRVHAITGKQYAPRECAACSTTASWEPQCSTCTAHFQRRNGTAHSSSLPGLWHGDINIASADRGLRDLTSIEDNVGFA